METETASTVETSAEEMNTLERMAGVFTSPGRVFASVAEKPNWVIPTLVVVAVSLVVFMLAGDIFLAEGLERQERIMLEQGRDPAEVEQALEMTEKFGRIFGYGAAVLTPFATVVVVAGVFLFIGNVIMGGKARYIQLLGVTAYSFLIVVLYRLVVLPIMLARETTKVTFSLAAFLPEDASRTFLYQLLTSVDVFYLWWAVVYAIGLGAVYKMRTQKMAGVVIGVYAVFAVVSAFVGSR